MDAVSGHGALIAMEPDPTNAPYVFEVIGQIRGAVGVGHSLASTETTAHNDTIDTYVPDGRITRDVVNITVNYLPHVAASYHKKLKDFFHAGQYFRIRIRGPLGVPGDDEEIYYGFLEKYARTDNERSGAREAVFTFRPSGPMTVDGTPYS